MRMALTEAAKGVGLTRPNPPVGAVVVRGGRVVGKGYHAKAGDPHAEVVALRDAGAKAKGATLYVTLEPCCTHGRTPPCTNAIIEAGIKRVVYGCVDPNTAHAGRADKILAKAGIKVAAGVLEDECRKIIRPFVSRILRGRPYVTLKLACTLDGKIADARGTSKWITGEQARSAVQDLRRSADAIMVGAETLRKDDPSLLPRPARGRKPLRVIVKGTRPLPRKAQVFCDEASAQTLVADGRKGILAILRDLARRDCMHMVCEGGGVLAEKLLRSKCVDALWIFYAPKIIGGSGTPSFAGPGWRLPQAPSFVVAEVSRLGDDVLVKLERNDV
jgi:diaminohydroxyphosphoribosylaminopyrimidine deaminase/5-amino-6-(5-phosphoribosylamino)uracil reductase